MSIKPKGAKSGKKLYETFFVGDQGTQYFIKPLKFTSETENHLLMDITFRIKNEIKDSAFVNFSIVNKELVKKLDSLVVKCPNYSFSITNFNNLFVEHSNGLINSRFSSRAKIIDIKNVFNQPDWIINQYSNGKSITYKSSKKLNSKIKKIYYEIFSLY